MAGTVRVRNRGRGDVRRLVGAVRRRQHRCRQRPEGRVERFNIACIIERGSKLQTEQRSAPPRQSGCKPARAWRQLEAQTVQLSDVLKTASLCRRSLTGGCAHPQVLERSCAALSCLILSRLVRRSDPPWASLLALGLLSWRGAALRSTPSGDLKAWQHSCCGRAFACCVRHISRQRFEHMWMQTTRAALGRASRVSHASRRTGVLRRGHAAPAPLARPPRNCRATPDASCQLMRDSVCNAAVNAPLPRVGRPNTAGVCIDEGGAPR